MSQDTDKYSIEVYEKWRKSKMKCSIKNCDNEATKTVWIRQIDNSAIGLRVCDECLNKAVKHIYGI